MLYTKKKYQALVWAVLALLTLLSGIFLSVNVLKAEEKDQETRTPESVIYKGRTWGTITYLQDYSWNEGGVSEDLVVIQYTFNVGGRVYNERYEYHHDESGLRVGGQLEVAYVTTYPNRNKPADDLIEYADPWWYFIGVLLPFVGVSVFFGFMAWKSWKLRNPARSLYQFH